MQRQKNKSGAYTPLVVFQGLMATPAKRRAVPDPAVIPQANYLYIVTSEYYMSIGFNIYAIGTGQVEACNASSIVCALSKGFTPTPGWISILTDSLRGVPQRGRFGGR